MWQKVTAGEENSQRVSEVRQTGSCPGTLILTYFYLYKTDNVLQGKLRLWVPLS